MSADPNVAEAVAETQAVPVMGIHRILAPTDFSPPARRALVYGWRLAQQFGAELVLVHVTEPVTFAPPHCSVEDFQKSLETEHQRISNQLKEQADCLAGMEGHSVTVQTRLLEGTGEPSREIVRLAKEVDADLIVIATHGYTGLKRVMMGSTAERVVRHAGCPVLVVREREKGFVAVTDPANTASD